MTIASLTLKHGEAELVAGARSYVYRMLARAFSFPDEELGEELVSGAWEGNFRALAGHLPVALDFAPLPVAQAAELQESYLSVFEVGPGKPYCPLYEGSHRSGRMKLMEETVRFYEHFGLRTTAGDHPDHLCTELEFMHYLAFKEAAAAAHGDETADVRRAQRDFLERHLCKWLPLLEARLQAARAAHPFYTELAGLAARFCAGDMAWLRAG